MSTFMLKQGINIDICRLPTERNVTTKFNQNVTKQYEQAAHKKLTKSLRRTHFKKAFQKETGNLSRQLTITQK